jgi:ABC-type transport system involved in multi-copper enzyme maturation permease subunit
VSARRIGLVAWHVFKENVRDRVLYGIGGFAVLLVGTAAFVGQLSAGEDIKVIKDLGLATIELAGIAVTLILGVGLVAREIDRRSVYALLAKPLPRWEFIVGKYLGLILTLVVNVAAMTIALYAVLGWLAWRALPQERGAWEVAAVDPRLLVAIVMITMELALLTAVATFFSAFSSSAVLSIGLTLGMLVAGWLSADLRAFGNLVDVSPVVARVVSSIGWIIPAFSAFDVKAQIVHGLPLPRYFVVLTLVYGALYTTGVLLATVIVFSRREFR